jgi:hypothetical protein
LLGALYYLGVQINALRSELASRIDALTGRVDALAARLDAHIERHAG